VPSGSYDPSDLGFGEPGPREVTLYVEPLLPSAQVGDARIKAIVTYPGDSGMATIHESVRFTVVHLDLDAYPHSNESTEETPGTPVLLNDDWECEATYDSCPPEGHRELEPIWDLDYTGGEVAEEDDLMRVTVNVQPADLADKVFLKLPSGAENIRLWPRATKGTEGEIITIPQDTGLSMGDLMRVTIPPELYGEGAGEGGRGTETDIYLEGIKLGRTGLRLVTTIGNVTLHETLNADVVTLKETQQGIRKVINAYDTDITFEVLPGTLTAGKTYRWSLDGNATPGQGAWENGTGSTVTVRYNGEETGEDEEVDGRNVQLEENFNNRRQTYIISVRVTSPDYPGLGLVIQKQIRVALGSYQGTALPPQSTAGVHTLFQWDNNNPVAFSYLPPGHYQEGANRIRYDETVPDNTAEAKWSYYGADKKVWGVNVYPLVWAAALTSELLEAIVDHGVIHLHQHVAVRDEPTSFWRALEDHYGADARGPRPFREAEAYCYYLTGTTSHFESEVDDVDWRFLTVGSKLWNFRFVYNKAMDSLGPPEPLPEPLRGDARQFLQDLYEILPFQEMRRPDYDFYVRAPQ